MMMSYAERTALYNAANPRARRYARVAAMTAIVVGGSGLLMMPLDVTPAKQAGHLNEFKRRREARAARQARGRG